MRLYKRYVDVVTMINKTGELMPLTMVWDNGVMYEIDQVLEVRNAASQVGGCGMLYRCRIGKVERNLFFERNRWFIESTRP